MMKKRASRNASKITLYVRTGLMLGALFFVFSLIQYSGSDDFRSKISMIFDEPGVAKQMPWIWCPQGVHEIERLGSVKASIQDAQVISGLCAVPIWALKNKQVDQMVFEPVLKAKNQGQEVLVESSQTDPEIFRISGLPVRSKNLRKKLDDLK